MKNIYFSLLLLFCTTLVANAQKIKIKEGSLSSLGSITSYDVKFTYDNMKVGKKSEETYVAEKKADYNKKEAGKGDKWVKNWIDDRSENYEPKFIQLFNENVKGQVTIKKGDDPNPYEMIVATVVTEPGFNIGLARRSAYVTLQITFREKETKKVLALIHCIEAPGTGAMGYDFDTGLRIQEGYAKAGKELGQYMRKKVF